MKHAKGLFKRPIRSHWCVASGWLLAASQRFKGFKVFKGLEGLDKGWQTAGLERFKGFNVFKGLEGLEGLRAGKRQA